MYSAGQYEGGYDGANGSGAPAVDDDASGRTSRNGGRRKGRPVIQDSEDEDAEGDDADDAAAPPPIKQDDDDDGDFEMEQPKLVATMTKSGRRTLRPAMYKGDSSDEDDEPVKAAGRSLRRGKSKNAGYGDGDGFVEPDEEFEEDDDEGVYGQNRKSRLQNLAEARARQAASKKSHGRATRSTRNSAKVDQSYEAEESPLETTEDDEELEIGSDDSLRPPPKRQLREKPKIDYYAIPPVESLTNKKDKGKSRSRDSGDPFAGLPHNLTGAQWAALYPEKNAQSDSVS